MPTRIEVRDHSRGSRTISSISSSGKPVALVVERPGGSVVVGGDVCQTAAVGAWGHCDSGGAMGGAGSVDYVVQPRPWEPGEVSGRWAAKREDEGWAGVGFGDHWFIEGSGGCANAFAQLGHAAASTTSLVLSTSFANNLFRSPVELAQAALTIQLLSGGRFELGIGAGWSALELTGAGLAFPDPGSRVRRL